MRLAGSSPTLETRIESRAAQHGHDDIRDAAQRLLDLMAED